MNRNRLPIVAAALAVLVLGGLLAWRLKAPAPPPEVAAPRPSVVVETPPGPEPSPVIAQAPPPAQANAPAAAPVPAETVDVEGRWGIHITGLRRSTAGTTLTLRYTVLDAEKAAIMAYQDDTSYIIDQATGVRYPLLKPSKSGSLRQTWGSLREQRGYQVILPNPGWRFKPGDVVTLVLGDFRAPNLTVE